MLTTDLEGAAGGAAQPVERGVVTMAKALELAAQLDDIVRGLRVDATAQNARERYLMDVIVGLLCSKAWAWDAARADEDVARKYRAALDQEREERGEGADDDLPF